MTKRQEPRQEPMQRRKTQTPTEALRALLESVEAYGRPKDVGNHRIYTPQISEAQVDAARAALREAESDPWQELVGKTFRPVEQGAGDSPEAAEIGIRECTDHEWDSVGGGACPICIDSLRAQLREANISAHDWQVQAEETEALLGQYGPDFCEKLQQDIDERNVKIQSLEIELAQLRERPNPTEFEQRTCCPRCASFDVQEYMGGAMACLACGHTDNCDDADWPAISAVRLELETLRAALRDRPPRDEYDSLYAAHRKVVESLRFFRQRPTREEALDYGDDVGVH